MALTKKQRELTNDIKYLVDELGLTTDLSGIDREFWTTHLELARKNLITTEVISSYLLMDEALNGIIYERIFSRRRTYQQLWRTKRFQAFNYYVLERIYLIQKLDFVQANTRRFPEKTYKDLYALNQLRNALAHSFFPEHRRSKPVWKHADIFSRTGFGQFRKDMGEATDYFMRHFLRASRHKDNQK